MLNLVTTLLLVILLAPSLYAGNVDTLGIGAKATALGGAYSAYADDPYAVYYNPAGLIQIKKPTISIGVHVVKPEMKVVDYSVDGMTAGPSTLGAHRFDDSSHLLTVPHLGFSLPVSPCLAIGVGIYAPYGMDVRWPTDSGNPGAYNSYHSWYRREVINPSVAWQIHKRISVGMGLVLGRSFTGVEYLAYSPLLSGLHNRFIETDMEDESNWSVNGGLLFKPCPNISLGLTYRGRTETKFRGTTKAAGLSDDSDLTGSGIRVYNTSVSSSTEIDSPEQVQGGVRYRLFDSLSLEADVVWTRWSSVRGYTVCFDKKFLDVPALGADNPGRTREYFPRNWEDTTQFRIGMEWKLNEIAAWRCSYFYDPSPVPERTFDLQWPDGDKRTYAMGLGLDWGWLCIDTVVQYTCADSRRVIDGESGNLNSSYRGGQGTPKVALSGEGRLWGGGITISYRY